MSHLLSGITEFARDSSCYEYDILFEIFVFIFIFPL